MLYYIDGYNLQFLNESCDEDLKSNRDKILDNLSEIVISFGLDIVVVFDAYKQQGEFSKVDYKSLEVVYTAYKQKADDYIIEAVERASVPSQIFVVTNDRKLSREVRSSGGKSIKIRDFFSLVEKKKKVDDDKISQKNFNHHDFDYYAKAFLKKHNQEN